MSKICQEEISQSVRLEEMKAEATPDIDSLVARLKEEKLQYRQRFIEKGFECGIRDAYGISLDTFLEIQFFHNGGYLSQRDGLSRYMGMFSFASDKTKKTLEESEDDNGENKIWGLAHMVKPKRSFITGWLNGVSHIWSEVKDQVFDLELPESKIVNPEDWGLEESEAEPEETTVQESIETPEQPPLVPEPDESPDEKPVEAKKNTRDGIYPAYANGIVRDAQRGLEWKEGPDRDMAWDEARSWVQDLGGDWRMPSMDELEGIYEKGLGDRNMTPLLKTSGWWVWSGETQGSSDAGYFSFNGGGRIWYHRDYSYNFRAFAVRSRNDDKFQEEEVRLNAPSAPDKTPAQGRYDAIRNNIVKDTKTGLEWIAGPDKDTTWDEAKSWVASLKLDGGGWRMPTVGELEGIYEKGLGDRNMTPLLKTTGWWVWSGETQGSSPARFFNFNTGNRNWYLRTPSNYSRAFAVRSRIEGVQGDFLLIINPESNTKNRNPKKSPF